MILNCDYQIYYQYYQQLYDATLINFIVNIMMLFHFIDIFKNSPKY